MLVYAFEPKPKETLVVAVKGDATVQEVTFSDTFVLSNQDRAIALSAFSKRVEQFVQTGQPDLVVVKPLENRAVTGTGKRNIKPSWFDTAEVRGVILAASAGAAVKVELRTAADVTRTTGDRKAKEYVTDDDFWDREIAGAPPKKYRKAALMAISALRSHRE